MSEIIRIENLQIGYRHVASGHHDVVFDKMNVAVGEGELVALLGRNGIGKSTFLRTLSGLQKPLGGEIYLCGKLLTTYTTRELATMISFVSTASLRVPYLKLFDLVAMGRFPYTGWMGKLSGQDYLKVSEAIEMVGLSKMLQRNVDTLSDGERQRAVIARALVQDTPIVILDEPTAFLDMPNKYEIVQLLRKLAHASRKAVIFSSHELSLSMRTADTVWIMTPNGLTAGNTKDEMVAAALQKMLEGTAVSLADIKNL